MNDDAMDFPQQSDRGHRLIPSLLMQGEKRE
jgi:hypothetical protein